jgi:hypothetical protein
VAPADILGLWKALDMRYTDIDMRWAGAMTLLWIGFLGATSAQQLQPPTERTNEIFSDRALTEPEPKDVSERLRQVDAAIVGRVIWSEVRSARSHLSVTHPPGPLGDVPDVTTENVVSIVEVLKGHAQMPASGAVIRIIQPLGTTTWNGNKVVRRDGKAKGLQLDAEYVLLLEWSPYTNQFTVGANDLFRISSGRVETPSNASYGLAQAGAPKEEFLAKLRAAAAQVPQNVR